jgi:hypothetical protein
VDAQIGKQQPHDDADFQGAEDESLIKQICHDCILLEWLAWLYRIKLHLSF